MPAKTVLWRILVSTRWTTPAKNNIFRNHWPSTAQRTYAICCTYCHGYDSPSLRLEEQMLHLNLTWARGTRALPIAKDHWQFSYLLVEASHMGGSTCGLTYRHWRPPLTFLAVFYSSHHLLRYSLLLQRLLHTAFPPTGGPLTTSRNQPH